MLIVISLTKEAESKVCFRCKPTGNCKISPYLKSGYYFNISPPNELEKIRTNVLSFEIGFIYRIRNKIAFGTSFLILATEEDERFGIQARYRKWLNNHLSLELTTGILFKRIDSDNISNGTGLVSNVSLNIDDLLSIDLMFDYLKYNGLYKGKHYSKNTSSLFLGISGCSYFSLVIPIIVGLVVLEEVASFEGF